MSDDIKYVDVRINDEAASDAHIENEPAATTTAAPNPTTVAPPASAAATASSAVANPGHEAITRQISLQRIQQRKQKVRIEFEQSFFFIQQI